MRGSLVLMASLALGNLGQAEVVEVDSLLSEDDQCSGGEQCALNALQFSARKATKDMPDKSNKTDEEENVDHCAADMVGRMRIFANDCLTACPEICGPVGDAVSGFLSGGEADAASAICASKNKLECMFRPENVDKCKPIREQASSFGFTLPKTSKELLSQCDRSRTAHGTEMEAGSSCYHGIVGRITRKYPQCFNACEGMCNPMQRAAFAYIRGGVTAAMHVICRYQTQFSCAYEPEHLVHCLPLFEKASSFGIEIPTSQEELSAACR